MGGHCFYCGEELGPDEIEVNERFYCSQECVNNERLDYEAERGFAMQERREMEAEYKTYDDGIY